MATEEIDLVDEIYGLKPSGSAGRSVVPESITWEPVAPVRSTGSFELKPAVELWNPPAQAETKSRRGGRVVGFAIAFGLAAAATMLLLTAAAVAAFGASANRVVPGVRVGSIDVSGLTRDQVVARLQTSYSYLGQGKATVSTPAGAAAITYQQAGRGPDVEIMTDAAMSVGHSGNPIEDAVVMLRSGAEGRSLPIVVLIDPTAVATRVRQLVGTNQVLPQDARVTVQGGIFTVVKSTPGNGIDEQALSEAIVNLMTQVEAPADARVDDTFVTIDPKVTSLDAQNAIGAAQKMGAELDLTLSNASGATTPTTTFKVDAQTVHSWIVFGTRADGTYGPSADPALVQTYLAGLSAKVAVKAVEPYVVYDKSGKATSLRGGSNGVGLDIAATTQAIEAHLEGLATTGTPGSAVVIVTAPVSPQITLDSLTGMTVLGAGQGAWTTTFFPGVANGNGANIRVPASLLNGQIVAPGQQFSFLRAVGPIDAAHGYAMGGVIVGGKSDHTGAMGGGICSASTTMFNAAARAGLQIDERHAHFYYIDRYPIGLDATVYSNGYEVWDLRWTNDTPNPILIRASSTKGSKSTITIQLWSLPLDRKVTFSAAYKDKVVSATDHTSYVATLKPGQQNRAEYPTPGFDTSRTRTVTDSTGKVVHSDTWKSHYTKVDGLLEVGITPKPTPKPSPTPPPTPTPTPTATAPTAVTNSTTGARGRKAT
jgi:vancomycin resistance protein YoaR